MAYLSGFVSTVKEEYKQVKNNKFVSLGVFYKINKQLAMQEHMHLDEGCAKTVFA